MGVTVLVFEATAAAAMLLNASNAIARHQNLDMASSSALC
jgi:hypothetical protein